MATWHQPDVEMALIIAEHHARVLLGSEIQDFSRLQEMLADPAPLAALLATRDEDLSEYPRCRHAVRDVLALRLQLLSRGGRAETLAWSQALGIEAQSSEETRLLLSHRKAVQPFLKGGDKWLSTTQIHTLTRGSPRPARGSTQNTRNVVASIVRQVLSEDSEDA